MLPGMAGRDTHSGQGRLSCSAMSSESHELHTRAQPADVGEGRAATACKAEIWSQLAENKLSGDCGEPVGFSQGLERKRRSPPQVAASQTHVTASWSRISVRGGDLPPRGGHPPGTLPSVRAAAQSQRRPRTGGSELTPPGSVPCPPSSVLTHPGGPRSPPGIPCAPRVGPELHAPGGGGRHLPSGPWTAGGPPSAAPGCVDKSGTATQERGHCPHPPALMRLQSWLLGDRTRSASGQGNLSHVAGPAPTSPHALKSFFLTFS